MLRAAGRFLRANRSEWSRGCVTRRIRSDQETHSRLPLESERLDAAEVDRGSCNWTLNFELYNSWTTNFRTKMNLVKSKACQRKRHGQIWPDWNNLSSVLLIEDKLRLLNLIFVVGREMENNKSLISVHLQFAGLRCGCRRLAGRLVGQTNRLLVAIRTLKGLIERARWSSLAPSMNTPASGHPANESELPGECE